VWGNLATRPQFAYSVGDTYVNAPANLIVSDSRFLIAILNSRITQYLISKSAAGRQGGFLEYKPMYVSQIPIPAHHNKKQIEHLVQIILDTEPSKRIKHDKSLDDEVYKVYKLTDAEIALIEGQTGGAGGTIAANNKG
jgi:adenine-specific DNA-methyltransferase